MSTIDIEGWGVKLRDLEELNSSPETSRLGMIYEHVGGDLFASANGNLSACYIILLELKKQILSGTVLVKVEFSTGEGRKYKVSKDSIFEDGKDITEVIK